MIYSEEEFKNMVMIFRDEGLEKTAEEIVAKSEKDGIDETIAGTLVLLHLTEKAPTSKRLLDALQMIGIIY